MPTAAAVLKPIHQVRKKNLVSLVENKFAGNASECARAIERSHTYMWQLVQGYRGIGEGSARHIEKMLELAPGTLDAAKQKRTTHLQANDDKGNVTRYAMVPRLALDALTATPTEFVPCPLADMDATKLFCTVIGEEDVVELERGDLVFVDRADVAPQNRKLFVVKRKTHAMSAMVLLARKRATGWTFGGTNEGVKSELAARDVTVIGRLLLIVRQLPSK